MKITLKDFNLNYEGLSDEAKAFAEKQHTALVDVINKALEGQATSEEVANKFNEVNVALKSFDADKFAQLIKDNDELREQVKSLNENIEKLQEKGISESGLEAFAKKADEMFESKSFMDFVSGREKSTTNFEGFNLKTVSLTNDYTGAPVGLVRDSNVIVGLVERPEVHLRSVIMTNQGDVNEPYLSYTTIYDVDRNARFVSENGELPKTSFKVKAEYTGTKRVGVYLYISKRMLKSKVYLKSWLVNNLLSQVMQAEDAQILFGDGQGDNLKGILAYSDIVDIATELSSGISLSAGFLDTTSPLAKYDNGAKTLVTLAKPTPAIKNSVKITFAGAKDDSSPTPADVTAFNKTFEPHWLNDTQFVIDLAWSTSEDVANPDEVTGTLRSGLYQSITTPNSADVVKSAFAYMQYAYFRPNAVVMNPLTVNAIECEKLTTGASLGAIEVRGGVKYIAGYPIIEKDSIPVGKALIGDFKRGCELVDFTNLYVRWMEDVNTAVTNQIACIAEEEIIFAVYAPASFAYFDIASLATQITKS